jgi:hypothetical protein
VTPPDASAWTSKPEGPAPEVSISLDIVRRGLMVLPVLVAVCAAIWGVDGAWSALYAVGLVLANFLMAAGIITVTSRISYGALMAGVLFGYIVRLAVIFVAVFLVKDASWVSLPAIGMCIVVTHLGLLIWELKYVAISLAYPGLKPKPAGS